jgi:hypothetical protein
MFSSEIDDTSWVDSFDIPSVFDPRLALYKEWHDFVFFDRTTRVFGLLNFAIHGNPYDARRGYGAALAFLVDPGERARTALKLIPLHSLTVSPFSPDFIGEGVSVHYQKEDHSFSIEGSIEGISFDLEARVVQAPVMMSQIGFDVLSRNPIDAGMLGAARDMARVWDKWVELPKLRITGKLDIGATGYLLDTTTGYQDHEGGRFEWGTVAGWDTGVLLCDPMAGGEPEKVSFLLYRYGIGGESRYGGVIVKPPGLEERFFDSEKMTITRSGEFAGARAYLPGVTRLLYPDYRPKIPRTIVFTWAASSDTVEITFTPKAACTIVVSGVSDEAETTFNEMYCSASLDTTIAGHRFRKTIPCWFESVRPRGRLKQDGP